MTPADTIREALRLAGLLRVIADELELGDYRVPTSIRTIREAAAALTELEQQDRLADTLREARDWIADDLMPGNDWQARLLNRIDHALAVTANKPQNTQLDEERRIMERDELGRAIVADYDRRREHWWGRFLLWLLRKTT